LTLGTATTSADLRSAFAALQRAAIAAAAGRNDGGQHEQDAAHWATHLGPAALPPPPVQAGWQPHEPAQ